MPAPRSRRNFLQLSSMAVGATALASCGFGGGGGSSDAVQFWNGFQDSETQGYFTTNFIDAYNASHQPKIDLIVKPIDSVSQLMKTAVAAGHGPDIIEEDGPAQALAYYNAGDLLTTGRSPPTAASSNRSAKKPPEKASRPWLSVRPTGTPPLSGS